MGQDLRSLADEDVMQLVRRGDARAFEIIYERHSAAAFSLAYRMMGTRSGAEDVTQDAFLSLWRSGARYDRAGIEERFEAAERTDVEAARREEAGTVRDALSTLPADQCQVIELAYFGGFTHTEIAEMLDMPVGTVKGRMRLGLDKLRGRLRGEVALG